MRRFMNGSAMRKVNTCWNAVDRHVENGRGEQTAIIYDSPITHTKREISYVELRNRVANSGRRAAGERVSKKAIASSSTCR